MYNKYLNMDEGAFSGLYRQIESEPREAKTEIPAASAEKKKTDFSLQRLLRGIDIDKVGILPIVILLLLLIDADDNEKLIIIALAVIFGI